GECRVCEEKRAQNEQSSGEHPENIAANDKRRAPDAHSLATLRAPCQNPFRPSVRVRDCSFPSPRVQGPQEHNEPLGAFTPSGYVLPPPSRTVDHRSSSHSTNRGTLSDA